MIALSAVTETAIAVGVVGFLFGVAMFCIGRRFPRRSDWPDRADG